MRLSTTPNASPSSSRLSFAGFFTLLAAAFLLAGCGATGTDLALAGQDIALQPLAARLQVGETLVMSASGRESSMGCSWSSSNAGVLRPTREHQFLAYSPGRATVIAQCGGEQATSSVMITSASTGPLVITRGGTYTGNWSSNVPGIPAVQVLTNEPVTIRNATITGAGDLIVIPPVTGGANVTVENVTGIAYDPGTAGRQRGSFITAEGIESLVVQHCSMYGVRFGVKVLSSTPSRLSVIENVAKDLEDRESDGQGGFLAARPDLGHFVMLNRVNAFLGAEIAWNQFTAKVGSSSTEDVVNIYKSQGSPTAVISVHDNYMEGNSSPASLGGYTGAGLIADGDAALPETAFVSFTRNQIVHTEGSGIEVAAGHDILVTDNRIVSCGRNRAGAWIAAPFVNAIVIWNLYALPDFTNIKVQNTAGGMLRPDLAGAPMVADLWTRPQDLNTTDVTGPNSFTDPCSLQSGANDLGAEKAERVFWRTKLRKSDLQIGDQHTPE